MSILGRFTRAAVAGVAAAVMLATLAACGGGNGNGTPPMGIAPDSGFLTLRITDAPVDDAVEVVIVFTGVELQRGPASTINIDFDTPKSLDLLQLRDGRTANLLDGHAVLPGNYEWLRLKISAEQNLQNGSRIRLRDGRQFPLFIPSGAESGLKLNRPFTVAQGGATRLVIDFDLRKSVVAPPGLAPNWVLRPTLRVFDELQVGTLMGTVDIAALAAGQQSSVSECSPGVYVFKGSGVAPDDMDGSSADGPDPIVYQPLTPPAPGAPTNYSIPFLEAGDYTVAFTCRFAVDADPTRSEYDPSVLQRPGETPTMRFLSKTASITAGTSARVDVP